MNLLLSPHNDDETLFAAYTLIREKPLVVIVTDSWIQPTRGDIGCSADERWNESVRATGILGCSAIRLGLRDDALERQELFSNLKRLSGFERVYIPAVQNGNAQHDLISIVGSEVFGERCIRYTTYTRTALWTTGTSEIIPTEEEKALKLEALKCYTSQINLPSTRPHFEAVIGKSEWLIP